MPTQMTKAQLKALCTQADTLGLPDTAPVIFKASGNGLNPNEQAPISTVSEVIILGQYDASTSPPTVVVPPSMIFTTDI